VLEEEVAMRVLAAHDAEGNIHQLVVSPPDAPLATVTPESGLLITEVEAPKVISGLDLSDPERSGQQLSELLQHLHDFRIEVGTKAKLKSKGP
jgi:hypothetical protein